MTTIDALSKIAKALNILTRDIGYAGLKDAKAITRQWISIEHIEPEKLSQLDIANIKILKLDRHTNKIKLGHLSANKFIIRLREVNQPIEQSVQLAQDIMAVLAKKGVPNYFGPQRFGNRAENHLLGELIIKNKLDEFVDMFLGKPRDDDLPQTQHARCLYENGDYHQALQNWRYDFSDHRRVLKALIQRKGNKKKAFMALGKHLSGLFVSAFQSEIFNRVLAARMPDIDKLLLGDMACKHVNGACFHVENPETEQPRCDAFEISPTGPLIGPRLTKLTGPAGEIENPILDTAQLNEDDLRRIKKLGGRGGRRPLRFQPRNPSVTAGSDDSGQYIEMQFELDAGCYATTLLREITKNVD